MEPTPLRLIIIYDVVAYPPTGVLSYAVHIAAPPIIIDTSSCLSMIWLWAPLSTCFLTLSTPFDQPWYKAKPYEWPHLNSFLLWNIHVCINLLKRFVLGTTWAEDFFNTNLLIRIIVCGFRRGPVSLFYCHFLFYSNLKGKKERLLDTN